MSQQYSAFVTGGASGIGAAICRDLAQKGWAVAVADVAIDRAKGVASEINGLAVETDITSPESVCEAVAKAEAEQDPIGVLVNCAGWDEFKPFVDTDEDFMAKVLAINLAGP